MEMNVNEIEVNGIKYIKKDSVQGMAKPNVDGLKYSIVRTYSAGVFAGYVKHEGKIGSVFDARMLWFWSGAASISQLSVDGVSNPGDCKFTIPVQEIELTEIIEVIPCTEKAEKCIRGVKEWKK